MDLQGGCVCGAVRYRLTAAPLIVHACHCRDCQRLTGAAFALNMWIEKSCVEADHAALKSFLTTAGSGKPHQVFYCGACTTHLWSKYHAAPGDTLLVRAGTLDHPEEIAPDVHIFTRSKLPWLVLPPGARAFEAFYKLAEVWPEASRERLRRNVEAQG
ncbi:MAG: GFA family protein [Stellaceae bacterium]